MGRTGWASQKMKVSVWCRLRRLGSLFLVIVLLVLPVPVRAVNWTPLPDTGQTKCYDAGGHEVGCPASGQQLYGQDAQYQGKSSAYQDNGNQTVSDQNSSLMWMKSDDGTKRKGRVLLITATGLILQAGVTGGCRPDSSWIPSLIMAGRFRLFIRFLVVSHPFIGQLPSTWMTRCMPGGSLPTMAVIIGSISPILITFVVSAADSENLSL